MPGPGLHGPSEVFIFLDGFDLTPESFTEASFSEESETAETTGLGDSFREHTPTGIAKVELELTGAIWNTCSARSHDIFSTGLSTGPQTAARLACIGAAGSTVGAPCEAFEGAHQTTYKVITSLEDLHRVAASYEMTGARDSGNVIHPAGEETTDDNTQSTSFEGTSSTFGGVGHLHLETYDGDWGGALTVLIQDSSDDIAYGTLLSFTGTTTTGSPVAERVEVAGEIQKYKAAAWTFAGAGTSGAATFFVQFSQESTF